MKKYCIVCGEENFSRSLNFCCNKCKQAYYYHKNKEKLKEYKKEYYQNNKDDMNENHNKWVNDNRTYWNEYIKNRRNEK